MRYSFRVSADARETIKRVLSILYVHRQVDQDIFIHSTQRSGSTMLFDAMAGQPRMKAVGEPFQERKRAVVGRYISAPRSRYGTADADTWSGMVRYLDDLGSGGFVGGFERTYNPTSVRHHFCTARNVYKILRALPLVVDLRTAFPAARHLVLVRHPIPTVTSRVRNGWHAPVEDYLDDLSFMARANNAQRRLIADLAAGDAFSRHLAVWVLEHSFLTEKRDLLEGAGVPIVAFEHIVADRMAAATWLAEYTALNAVALAHHLGRPSRSTRHSTLQTGAAIEAGYTDQLLDGWVARADHGQLALCQAALAEFRFGGYRADDPRPRDWLTAPPW